MNIPQNIRELVVDLEREMSAIFYKYDRTAQILTERVLDSFAKYRISTADLNSTNGYGYGDVGREKIDAIFADLFGAQAAFARHNIVSGTHALSIALFSLLRPGDTLLSVTGSPYDTLFDVINGEKCGSLLDFGINYRQIDLTREGVVDFDAVGKALYDKTIKVVFIQRSKGYLQRQTLLCEQIGEIIKYVKNISPDLFVIVDNCYGEFVESTEPSHFNADLVVGSLIKNPGGGIAQSGGYIAGTSRAVTLASYRLTAPGIGLEVGATLGQNEYILRGLFMAPTTVAAAKKTATLAAGVFERLGYEVNPKFTDVRGDIVQSVNMGSETALCAFCRGIQSASPIDSFVTPLPWEMPGYTHKVIMAAGTFVSGASIELSADGPIKPPYTAFFQGALTYEAGRLGIMSAAAELGKL